MALISDLSKVVGSFRAENLGEDLFSLYTQPSYFPQLLTPIPCILQGGRGSGKTTVLKSMSYEGRLSLLNQQFDDFDNEDYVGIYYKLETGIVNAFFGGGKVEEYWQHAFSHFINLQLCKLLCAFGLWYQEQIKRPLSFNKKSVEHFCISIGINSNNTLEGIRNGLDLAIAQLEADVNFAADSSNRRQVSIGTSPRRLTSIFQETPELKSKTFYFLFDEYENLREYQQIILNTFIKQADAAITFKVGIRELGFKSRHTINPNEQLIDPADFVLIDISERLSDNDFEVFAKNVLTSRFEKLRAAGNSIPYEFPIMLERLSEEQEALKLGGEDLANVVKDKLFKVIDKSKHGLILRLSLKDLLMIRFLSLNTSSPDETFKELFEQITTDEISWKTRTGNYNYASLFTLRSKKTGLSKYYCGWDTFITLSGRNIRYLLQLVLNVLVDHMNEGKSLEQVITAECQTKVAAEVGKKNLWELEGISIKGAQLMKVVLGFGELFHRMAINATGHAPEVNQFQLPSRKIADEYVLNQVNDIIASAVMHLAIQRTAATKLSGRGDTKDFDYMLHPIFAPFFVYSHRKKRKIAISQEDILGMINTPTRTINLLLTKQNRIEVIDDDSQLKLFGQ